MSGQRPGIIVQARTDSTRLPGKVLARLQGDTLLGHLIQRLRRCRSTDTIVIATTSRPEDEAIVNESLRHEVAFCRGSTDDVLSRYLGAAWDFDIDPVIRITSDCPLSDPVVIDRVVSLYQAHATGGGIDGAGNARPGARTFPRGLDVEVVARKALEDADRRLDPDAPEREHVTQYLYRNPESYRFEDLRLPLDLSFLRWTVDTGADLDLIRAVYDELFPWNPEFSMEDVLGLLGRRPELLALNAHVRQKDT